jgi:hypothetical protein
MAMFESGVRTGKEEREVAGSRKRLRRSLKSVAFGESKGLIETIETVESSFQTKSELFR